MIESLLSRILCHFPNWYRYLLLLKTPFNSEKAAYIQLIHRGDVILEIGANTGYFTRLFSHLTGSSGKVIAFEPIPKTRLSLVDNVKAWGLRNVLIMAYAVSDRNCDATMFVPGVIHGQASLKQHMQGGWGQDMGIEKVSVKCRTLDDMSELSALPSLDFIKVDVEGAELLVLKGARQLLFRYHPILHLEIEAAWMKAFAYSPEDLETYLRELGYRHFTSYDRHWQPLENLSTHKGGFNVVCTTNTLPRPSF